MEEEEQTILGVEEEENTVVEYGGGFLGVCTRRRNLLKFLLVGVAALLLVVGLAAGLSWGGGAEPADDDDDDGVESTHRLLLISIDALRWKYLQNPEYVHPTLDGLLQAGVSAPMQPVFPSKTFPNHYSIVTGLYPESHGIVSNTFYDPVYDETFNISGAVSKESRWWGGEPLWVTAEKQGMIAGCYFWPGSDVQIDGTRPTYWKMYDKQVPYDTRVDTILEWLQYPESKRPSFLTLYMAAVDDAGHTYGPDNTEALQAAVTRVDNALARLLDGIEALGMTDINIVITSDHGMAETGPARVVDLSQYMDVDSVQWVDMGVLSTAWPIGDESEEEMVARVYGQLSSQTIEGMQVYTKETVPKRFQWSDNRRIGGVIIVADNGWTLVCRPEDGPSGVGGAHGYDNEEPDMTASFIAAGPNFLADGSIQERFFNLNLYSLFTHILHLEAAPNNGTLSAVEHFLSS